MTFCSSVIQGLIAHSLGAPARPYSDDWQQHPL